MIFLHFQWNEVIAAFQSGMPVKKHRRRIQTYHNCFTSSEAVTWLHCYLMNNPNFGSEVTRKQCDFARFYPNFEGEDPRGGQGPSTNLTRGFAARRLFKMPPCRAGTMHLQTPMPSPGFEPMPYGTAVNVTNHCTG
ncbi:DEP domain-containing protein 1A [Trichonephila clavipes]|nr:DEP domain-containing protein 1A [Trichonephila clavipes]